MNDAPLPWDVIVVGAGAAGLLAAARAAARGRKTLLLEKNAQAGVKILMSGGTRCNVTHDTDIRGIIDAYGPPGRFLHSALAALSPTAVREMFADEGTPTKVEPLGKVFPVSNKAADVLQSLIAIAERCGAEFALDEPLINLDHNERHFSLQTSRRSLLADKVIITTGGRSYPGSGTSGDGYAWAAALGHTIVEPKPALTPVVVQPEWTKQLRGVTIGDVHVGVVTSDRGNGSGEDVLSPAKKSKGKRKFLMQQRGSVLFTHFGLSGPAILDVSRVISRHPKPHWLDLICDLLPEQSVDALEQQLQQQCAEEGKKTVASFAVRQLPRRLVEAVVEIAEVPSSKRGAELSARQRRRLAETFKQLRIPVASVMGFKKAEVTAGGVALREVDSKTMQSKLVPNLYLAGEILDLDGPIGGYNFQAAFSTGYLAGESV